MKAVDTADFSSFFYSSPEAILLRCVLVFRRAAAATRDKEMERGRITRLNEAAARRTPTTNGGSMKWKK